MDKKNTTIGVLLLLAAFAVLFYAPRSVPPPTTSPTPAAASPEAASPASTATAASAAPAGASTPAPAAALAPANGTPFAAINRAAANATVIKLENDFIEAHLTNYGGAVRDVAFKKYPAIQGRPEPYVFNHLHEDPILAFTDFPGLGRTARYELVRSSATEVVYRTVLDGRIEVTRLYRLTTEKEPGGDPYRLHHETTFRNLTTATAPLPRAALSLGTATLVNEQDTGQYLSVASYDGDSPKFIERGDLEGGGFGALFGGGREPKPVLENPGQVIWGGVKNQFFASTFTPEKPAVSVIARRIELPLFPGSQGANIGMTGAARFELPALAGGASARLAGSLYVGPQEYKRLAKFAHNEDRVLPYTQYFFNRIFLSGYVAPFLNLLLNATHNWVGNWGVAVILMTLILKIVSLPFTLAASRSAKRMAKLQPEMQAIKEKYKDNPQKQQQATMEVFKKHKVNPVGGCIPILITFPLFIGFFAMLQCTAELRFAPFLWAADLAAPDTIATVFGLPINIMPLLMGATMYFQMQLTPTPSVDNMQMKMMKFMPFIFTLFCYNFSCALALYSTINGIFTIGQQLVINKMKDPEPVVAVAAPGAKPIKNVTPKKGGKQ
jgi:YidC/Oxa1 family membrane protein insertase